MKADQSKRLVGSYCCEAGAVASPDPCPWHDPSYHDRRLARRKRNPWFRFWFWRESRRMRR